LIRYDYAYIKDVSIAKFFKIDDVHIMCTKPPRCVLFRQSRDRGAHFTSLEDGIIPVFPIERSITIKNHSIRRRQVPMCAAFGITDYKSQAQTFTEALLDLKPRGRDPHREFCSFYVELGRLTTSQGLHLLEKLEWADIEKLKPHPELIAEMARLQALQRQTLARWHAEIN
jgi:hypothetical protein